MPHSEKGKEEETVPIDSESVKQNNSAVRGSEREKSNGTNYQIAYVHDTENACKTSSSAAGKWERYEVKRGFQMVRMWKKDNAAVGEDSNITPLLSDVAKVKQNNYVAKNEGHEQNNKDDRRQE